MAKKFKESEYEGIYRAANKSFGFVKINDDEEIYVSSKDSLHAMNDDRVIVKLTADKNSAKKKREGIIIKILERDSDVIVGYFAPSRNYGFVIPINSKIPFDIHVEKRFWGKAVKDSIVEAKLLPNKKKTNNPEGVILKVIGNKNDPNDEITAIVRDFKIRCEFSEAVLKEAERVAVNIEKEDLINRKDLRNKCFVTIDGEDTKDIDDAVCLETLNNGNMVLYVSIADVTHYVKEGSNLDREALKRGNSVYLLDRVIPMLPHVLSNGMCSLNEGEDRLSMTCEMEFNDSGKIVSHEIYESIINSKKRMTYHEVQDLIDEKETNLSEEIANMIRNMISLSRKIRKRREERGSIDFNIKETYIQVDEKLRPIEINERERIEAYKLIEDFMVSANETVAEEFYYREVPFLYRTHEPCNEEKIEALKNTIANLGVNCNIRGEVRPIDMQKLLKQVENEPYQFVVEKLALRSMSQAKYTKNPLGHFALASKYYTHFTSPIRRYNDLQIHRIIKEVLENKFTERRREHYESILDSVALNISKTERVAIECERDINDLKKCEYMRKYLGCEFIGTISGLTNFGIFVELDNTVEGMIPLRDIRDDHYEMDEARYQIIGVNSKRVFSFGQTVKVRLAKCSPEIRAIDFVLVE